MPSDGQTQPAAARGARALDTRGDSPAQDACAAALGARARRRPTWTAAGNPDLNQKQSPNPATPALHRQVCSGLGAIRRCGRLAAQCNRGTRRWCAALLLSAVGNPRGTQLMAASRRHGRAPRVPWISASRCPFGFLRDARPLAFRGRAVFTMFTITPGFPRFTSRGQYAMLTQLPQYGCMLPAVHTGCPLLYSQGAQLRSLECYRSQGLCHERPSSHAPVHAHRMNI